jgi:hypothetical protein
MSLYQIAPTGGTRARETSGEATTSGDRDAGSGPGGRSLDRAPDDESADADTVPTRSRSGSPTFGGWSRRVSTERSGTDSGGAIGPTPCRLRPTRIGPCRARHTDGPRTGDFAGRIRLSTGGDVTDEDVRSRPLSSIDRRHGRRRSLEVSHSVSGRRGSNRSSRRDLRRPAVSRRSRTRNLGRTCTDRGLSIADQSGRERGRRHRTRTQRGRRRHTSYRRVAKTGSPGTERVRKQRPANPVHTGGTTESATPSPRTRPEGCRVARKDLPDLPQRPSGRSVSTGFRTRSRQTDRWHPSDWPTVAGPDARGSQPPGRGASRPAAGPLPSFHRRGLPGRPRRGPPARAGPRPVA